LVVREGRTPNLVMTSLLRHGIQLIKFDSLHVSKGRCTHGHLRRGCSTFRAGGTWHHRHSGRIRSTENNTQCFSRKNENTNDEPEIIFVSHLKVSQISKIKSKKGTGTWNLNRMTTFQGQSAKRHSNKKKFKSGQNQPNAIFIFKTFRNHRQKILMLFHIYKCRRFRKSNQNRAPELGIPAE